MSKPKLIVICGPTSSGKSGLAMKLAPKFQGEIVIADSRQVYRHLDIGTSKPTRDEQKQVPHHLVDIREPSEVFTAGEYKKLAEQAIADIHGRGKLPFLVGGTGLYIDAVAGGLDIPDIPPDQKLRDELEKLETTELLEQLKELDPEFAAEVDTQNKRRLVRALEVIKKTGQKFSDQRKLQPVPYHVLYLAIDWPRDELYQRIDQVIDRMMDQGLIDEVKQLLDQGIPYERLQELGLEYRFISQAVTGKLDQAEAIQELKYKSHQFAKRQLSWFRRNKKIHWLKPAEVTKKAELELRTFLD